MPKDKNKAKAREFEGEIYESLKKMKQNGVDFSEPF
jgi:predicted CopG family antitoxin